MIIFNKKFISKISNYIKWGKSDTIFYIQDTLNNQYIELNNKLSKYKSTSKYICFRNLKNICIYVKKSQIEDFYTYSDIYNSKNKTINLTKLKTYRITKDTISIVNTKCSPFYVAIREIDICKIDDIVVIIVENKDIDQRDELYHDLIDIHNMKEKYNLK